jgi:hypothetical protein
VSISLIVGALASWAMDDLSNTAHFQAASQVDNAISGATEVAIQSIRYYPNFGATASPHVAPCWTPPSGTYEADVYLNTYYVAVWCSTSEDLQSPNTRVVTFWACAVPSASVTNATLAGNEEGYCQGGTITPTLKAMVTFDDYPSGGGGLLSQTCSGGQGICGFAATTTQWTWS